MRIVFAWEWINSLDVIVRFDEGIGEVLRSLAHAGHEVWITTWGGPAEGKDQGVNFLLIPPINPKDKGQWVEAILDLEPDVLLAWGTIDHAVPPLVKKERPDLPMLLFLAGGGVEHPNRSCYDHFFVETKFHVEDLGPDNATLAMGVMADRLQPIQQVKAWDVFLPSSFTANKRYSLFCDVIEEGGLKGVAVGPINDEGCWIECKKVHAPTFGYVSRSVLRDFYCASRVSLLTGGAWGGSQRAVLESLACGIPAVVCEDNFQLDPFTGRPDIIRFAPPQPKLLLEQVQEFIKNPVDPKIARQFVMDNYTAEHYYDAVRSQIERVTQKRREVASV